MIEPINFSQPILDRRFNFDKEELTSLELQARTVKKMNEVIEVTNTVDGRIEGKEDKSVITVNRKLSPNGNFTGSIDSVPVNRVLGNIEDNHDKVIYLADQFSNGQTGQIVDGGFFENSNIAKNYDGGVF